MAENSLETVEENIYPPWNFSWIVENQLAAMAWPQTIGNLKYLYEEQGIKHLVTLSPEKRPPIYDYLKLDWTEIAIEEFEAPTVKDILKFIDVCQRCHIKNQVSEFSYLLFTFCTVFFEEWNAHTEYIIKSFLNRESIKSSELGSEVWRKTDFFKRSFKFLFY